MGDRGEGTWKDTNDICLACRIMDYYWLIFTKEQPSLRDEGQGLGDIWCGKDI